MDRSDAALYSLWVDWFEDPRTVADACDAIANARSEVCGQLDGAAARELLTRVGGLDQR